VGRAKLWIIRRPREEDDVDRRQFDPAFPLLDTIAGIDFARLAAYLGVSPEEADSVSLEGAARSAEGAKEQPNPSPGVS
jgi:hypothetical protein